MTHHTLAISLDRSIKTTKATAQRLARERVNEDLRAYVATMQAMRKPSLFHRILRWLA